MRPNFSICVPETSKHDYFCEDVFETRTFSLWIAIARERCVRLF